MRVYFNKLDHGQLEPKESRANTVWLGMVGLALALCYFIQ